MSDPRDTQQSRQRCTCSSTDMRQCENDAVYRGQGKFGFLLACEGHVPYLLVQIGQVEKLAAQPSDGPALPYEKCGQLLRTVGDKTLTCSRRKRHGGFCNNYMDSPESVAPRPPAPSEPLRHLRDWLRNKSEEMFAHANARRESGVKSLVGVSAADLKAARRIAEKMAGRKLDIDDSPDAARESAEMQDRIADKLEKEARQLSEWSDLLASPAPRVEAPAPLPSPNCTTCGAVTNPMRSCDVTMGTYCINCWPKTACGLGMHDEGCETLIMSYTEPSAAPSPTLPPVVCERCGCDVWTPSDERGIVMCASCKLKRVTPERAAELKQKFSHYDEGEKSCGNATSMSSATGDSAAVVAVPTNGARAHSSFVADNKAAPSPTAAEGERPRCAKPGCNQLAEADIHQDCDSLCDDDCGCHTFVPQADRGAVQTALPDYKFIAKELRELDFWFKWYEERWLDADKLVTSLHKQIAELKSAPTPLSAEELAPLRSAIYKLLSTNTIGPKDGQAIVFSEFLNELDAADRELAKRLPGVAVVRK